jgi:hypothetical protein
VDLTRCPYDGAELAAHILASSALRLQCFVCDAAWERRDTVVERVRRPDRDKLRLARQERAFGLRWCGESEPLPITPGRSDRGSPMVEGVTSGD